MRKPLVLGLSLAMVVSIALAAQSAQELYERGLVQEHARGDLKQAIVLYAQAAEAAGTNRALAAKALIRIAGLHEKLGANRDAERTYAELLRTYPEQTSEVAAAQERLKVWRRTTADAREQSFDRATDSEVAARLAAFIWRDVPDAPLLQAAQRGELGDLNGITRQVARMLRDKRSAALLDNFFATWLSLDRLKRARPDPVLFPQVDAELLDAMGTETRLFVQSQVRGDHDAVELWTAPYTFVNERLARHYGISGVSGKDFRRVRWPNGNRAGLLGQAGMLTALSTEKRTSPTLRGTYVMSRFFGMEVPEPPANIPPLAEPQPREEPAGTMRERLLVHRTNPQCASCHAMFDPMGLALENFDAVGRWRTTDSGAPIDASGAFTDGTRFNGPIEMRAGLLRYRDAYYTSVTRQLLAYALNRKGRPGRVYEFEMPSVRQVVRTASAQGYRWSAIIGGIAASAPFQAREVIP